MQLDLAPDSPRWAPASVPSSAKRLADAGLPEWLAGLLARRGVETAAEANSFLDPGTDDLHDPHLLTGLTDAVDRLARAREGTEKIAIVGDYDVDGLSATALLTAVFRACGLEVETILPHRLHEGYGFQPVHVQRAVERSCRLIVTADCGSTAHPALATARDHEIDVIVTDHHLGEQKLPEWVLEINPHREPSSYPFRRLAGAGVAFKLAVGLAARVGRPVSLQALLRMTCLGTICDLVPLVGENRTIAALGLAALGDTRSVGLRALMERAGVQPPFTAADVGYRLGPRLNAAGRLASPQPALDLLLTTDRSEAARLADELDGWNRQRQSAEARVVEEAEALFRDLLPMPPVLVGWSSHWHRGVVGIAAGRIARLLHRPTILFSVEKGSANGSGRSLPGIHLYDFLCRWQDEYRRFGGHAQAVGLTVAAEVLPELQSRWLQQADREWPAELLIKRIEYELGVTPDRVNDNLLQQLRRLEPFGVGNRQPVLRVGPLRLDGRPRRFGKGHLGARALGPDGERLELLGWGWQEREHQLDHHFEVLGCLEIDRYHGGPVLRLLEARPYPASTPISAGLNSGNR